VICRASDNKQLIWRGQATVDNVSNSRNGDERQTKYSIDKMFKQYPLASDRAKARSSDDHATHYPQPPPP
jgi:hypothetical protein